jgi:hypothetical protein
MAEDFDRMSSEALDHRESGEEEIETRAASAVSVVTRDEVAPAPKTADGRALTRRVKIEPYNWPVGGWGSLRSVADIVYREKVPVRGDLALWKQNKPDGFM